MKTLDASASSSSSATSTLCLQGKRVHFVGIGGCGMSGLARLVRAAGATVSGTDLSGSDTVDSLEREGIAVTLRQDADTLPADCDLLVISAAISAEHPELSEAKRRGVRVVKYAQMLGQLMIGRTGVAIAGTHGKSTTTALLSHILIACELDPSFIVGATCEQIGGGCRVGRPDVLIAEACEYDRSFHNYHPTHAAILNIEEDHLDIYKGIEDIVESFQVFARRIAKGGSLLIGHDGAHRTTVASGLECKVQTIGFSPQADWQVIIDRTNTAPGQDVTLRYRGEPVCRFTLHMPGDHMAYNACASAILAHRLGAKWPGIAQAIGTFRGLDRRMQWIGTRNGVRVIDDYGHHPTEVDATLRALRTYYHPEKQGGRLICVFQPHQHSRTRFLLKQFAASFSHADVVIVPHIYFVRDSEADCKAVSAADLVHKLHEQGVLAVHIDAFDDIVTFLKHQCKPNDLLVVMGAGPVWKVGKAYVNAS